MNNEYTEYIISNYKTVDGTIKYSILWLDTGSRTCGYTSKIEAQNNAERIIMKSNLRKENR